MNLNGLIQSGIAEKSVTINQLDGLSNTALMNRFGDQIDTNGNGVLDASEWTDSDGDNIFTLADLSGQGSFTLIQEADNGSFSGSGYDREVRGLFDAYYDSEDDSVIVSGFEAKGGEVFIGGKLISTGNGQINVLDGYASMNVNNQSGKDLKITGIETGEVEGKITLIDNLKLILTMLARSLAIPELAMILLLKRAMVVLIITYHLISPPMPIMERPTEELITILNQARVISG